MRPIALVVGQAFQPDVATSCAVRLESLTYVIACRARHSGRFSKFGGCKAEGKW